MPTTETIKLTQYSHGAGCGCKISPAVLDTILHSQLPKGNFPALLVGNDSRDDAAVFELYNNECIISTTDFFMPIVDDATTFGRIASVNAISDVYAMGGKPLLAIAILGWPVNKVPAEVAAHVLDGSRMVCAEASIPLAGGHSIDCPEPVFGLAVTGVVQKGNLKRNDTAKEGDILFLTKPLGVGLITTAHKRGEVEEVHYQAAIESMLKLNSFGAIAGTLPYVSAMTDVTGFGLLGHLTEMCQGSNVSAILQLERIPKFSFIDSYVAKGTMPGGTQRNWASYGSNISPIDEGIKAILADPQTSGGLLLAVNPERVNDFIAVAASAGLSLQPFGQLTSRAEYLIKIR